MGFYLTMRARGEETFVTRKITRGMCNIALGLQDCIYMGNINALRIGVMQRLCSNAMDDASAKKAKDYVIATGKQYSVREFIMWSADALGIEIVFEGKDKDEVAKVTGIKGDLAPKIKIGQVIMRIDPLYYRPTEVDSLLGDSRKAKKELG